jgi:hypothetical protein
VKRIASSRLIRLTRVSSSSVFTLETRSTPHELTETIERSAGSTAKKSFGSGSEHTKNTNDSCREERANPYEALSSQETRFSSALKKRRSQRRSRGARYPVSVLISRYGMAERVCTKHLLRLSPEARIMGPRGVDRVGRRH